MGSAPPPVAPPVSATVIPNTVPHHRPLAQNAPYAQQAAQVIDIEDVEQPAQHGTWTHDERRRLLLQFYQTHNATKTEADVDSILVAYSIDEIRSLCLQTYKADPFAPTIRHACAGRGN